MSYMLGGALNVYVSKESLNATRETSLTLYAPYVN